MNTLEERPSAGTSVFAAGLLTLVLGCLLLPIGAMIADASADISTMSVTAVTPDTASDVVAATGAEFRVDESGAATYSIPIYTVPGTAGVAPSLALSYSSQGGYGPLGKGWSIGGLSSIARCRASREAGDFIVNGVATDGNPTPINYTASDRYCLDGQRLVPGVGVTACAAVGGMSVQTLRTEIESFQRVCAYTPSGNSNGPAFFTVERNDGSTSWYGDRVVSATQNLGYNGYVKSTAPGKTAVALSWLQTRFQDSTGNYIDYVYTVPTAGEHLVSEVRYTGKTVLSGQLGTAKAPFARVSFTYSARPTADVSKGYASGGVLTQSRRLDGITVCAANTSSCAVADQARHYKLGYSTSTSGSKYQNLTSVQECRDNSSAGVCLLPTKFTWTSGRHEFATVEKPANLSFATDHIRGFKTGDINGDGRQDIALLYLAGSGCVGGTWVVTATSTLTGTGVPTFQNARFNCVPTNIVDRGEGAWHLLDYDGDGRDDLFVSSTTGLGWKVHPSDGIGFNMSVNLISGLSPIIPSVNGKNDQVQLADLNGDGLIDIVYPRDNQLRARVMQRSGSAFAWGGELNVVADSSTFAPFDDPRCSQPGYMCYRSVTGAPSPKTGFTQLADFNGDAASDLLLQVEDTIWWNEECVCYPGQICYEPQGGRPTPVGNPRTSATITAYNTEETASSRRKPRRVSITSTCGEQWEHRTRLHLMTVRSATSSQITVGSYADIMGNPNAISLADANGDGLTDLFYQPVDKQPWRYLINTGSGMQAEVQLPASSSSNYESLVRFADVNGDGRADVLRVAGTYKAYYAMLALPGGGFAAQAPILGGNASICGNTNCDPAMRSPMFMDLDGDGQLDFLSLDYSSGNLGLYISRAGTRFTPRDVVSGIENGLGAQTQITYAPLTNSALYRRDTGSRSYNWGRGAPVQDLLAPMYAVARAASSSPQAGNPNAMATVHYRYAGAKVQAGGRGFLGFREIATVDPNHNSGYVTTASTYHQNFPFAGMPARTIKRAVASGTYVVPTCLNGTVDNSCFATPGQGFAAMPGNWFSDSSQVWESDTEIAGTTVAAFNPGVQAPVHVRTAGTEEKLRDPFGGAQTSRVVTTFSYGAYGDVGSTTVDTYDGTATSPMSTVVTANTYGRNTAMWRLGRLNGSTVTHSRPNRADVVRTSSFAYAMSGPVTGLMVAERSQAGGPADQDLRKQYVLDEYGNQTQVTTCAAPVSCSSSSAFHPASPTTIGRYSRTVYDSRGRYPIATYEPFWSGSGTVEKATRTVISRNLFGDVTEARDVNGASAVAVTGTFGRPFYSWVQSVPGGLPGNPADGLESWTRYRWCGTSSGQVSCPTGARFRQEVKVEAGATEWTYHDVLGRPMMKATETFNVGVSGKDVSAACTDYDAAGKPQRISNPFFLGGTAGADGPTGLASVCVSTARMWTTTLYDVLGRQTDVAMPDGAIASTYYIGRSTKVTDPLGNATTQARNAKGELVQVTDAYGLVTSYWYLADGSMYLVSRDAGRGAVQNRFFYDTMGRKIRQVDPDSGTTWFEYNALGELTAEVSADGSRVENEIDGRGRVWRKTVLTPGGAIESQSTFEYDTATYGYGQPASETITGQYASWAGQGGTALSFSRQYSYDALGRAASTTTTIDGVSYPAQVMYDALGRAWKSQDASGRWTKTQYTARGHLKAVCPTTAAATTTGCPGSTVSNDPTARSALIVLETDPWGRVNRERRGQSAALEVSRSYWPDNGRIAGICAGNQSNCNLMQEGYGWDANGNLHTHQKEGRYLEAFKYDKLNRLLDARLLMQDGVTVNKLYQSMEYDALGNLCRRHTQGWATREYTYAGRAGCGLGDGKNSAYGSGGTGTVGPHQISALVGPSNTMYAYHDARGQQTVMDYPGTASDRTVLYSADGQAHEIGNGNGTRTRFWYGPDGQRYKREDGGRRTLYLGNVEIVVDGGVTTTKRTVAGVLLQTIVGSSATNHYLFHDQLGSLVRIADANGAVVNSQDYLALGGRRNYDSQAAGATAPTLTTRGFTGHEHVDAPLPVVHMNARLYDPYVGRFLQPDPMVQAPDSAQSWNAYTYVFNNPLTYTDPTGMFSWRQVLGIAVAIVGTIVTAGMDGGFFIKLGVAIAFGAASGYIATGTLRGALTGAFTAGLTFGVGWMAQGWDIAGQMAAQAVTGGVLESLQGGSFGHGFIAAGLTAAFMPQAAHRDVGVRAVRGALIGGTISRLTGGKFANGALSGAIQTAMMKGDWESIPTEHQEYLSYSNDTYHPSRGDLLTHEVLTGLGADVSLLSNPKTGFNANVYQNGERFIVSYAGSNGFNDWIKTNIPQALGVKNGQYAQARDLARHLQAVLGNKIIFTGHSLGGGLASVAALATGLRAVTFNAAGVHGNTLRNLGISARNANALVTTYRSSSDILSSMQSLTPAPGALGSHVYLAPAGVHGTAGLCRRFGPCY